MPGLLWISSTLFLCHFLLSWIPDPVSSPIFPLTMSYLPPGGCYWWWRSSWLIRPCDCRLRSETAQSSLPPPVRPLGKVQYISTFLYKIKVSALGYFPRCPIAIHLIRLLISSFPILFVPLSSSFPPSFRPLLTSHHFLLFIHSLKYADEEQVSRPRVESPFSNTYQENFLPSILRPTSPHLFVCLTSLHSLSLPLFLPPNRPSPIFPYHSLKLLLLSPSLPSSLPLSQSLSSTL